MKDKKVDYLLEKLNRGYRFSKKEWPGGDGKAKLIPLIKKNVNRLKRELVKTRSKKNNLSVKKDSTSSKRRRSARNSQKFDHLSRDDLLARVECLESGLVAIKEEFGKQVF